MVRMDRSGGGNIWQRVTSGPQRAIVALKWCSFNEHFLTQIWPARLIIAGRWMFMVAQVKSVSFITYLLNYCNGGIRTHVLLKSWLQKVCDVRTRYDDENMNGSKKWQETISVFENFTLIWRLILMNNEMIFLLTHLERIMQHYLIIKCTFFTCLLFCIFTVYKND